MYDVLKKLNPDNDYYIQIMFQVQRMNLLHKVIVFKENVQSIEYNFEVRACGKISCAMCRRMERKVRVPETSDVSLLRS